MAKTFREWTPEQLWLLPPSVKELVPEGHLAHFVRDTVREELDLSEIYASYSEERGYPPYHPALMTAILLYGYCQGVYSSRRIARALEERVDFMAVSGRETPDFRTISEFRRRHLVALRGLFRQVVVLCQKAGLARLGHVAIDGTKVAANASLHKAMSYERMKKEDRRLKAEVQGWLDRAEAADRAEDREFGEDRRGDELPEWVKDKAKRREKIREAKAALEREAKEKADEERAAQAKRPESTRGPKPAPPSEEPPPTAQRNFTDPESRVLKTRSGFVQGYNAQLAVDADSQVIVAQEVVAQQNDGDRLVPLLDQIRQTTRRRPREISADAGYCSEAVLEEVERRRVRAYIATGRQVHGTATPTDDRLLQGSRSRAMRARLRRGGFRGRYRLRKQTVEPVIGQIKAARGLRQFLLRGLEKVRGEWSLVATAHNLLKLFRASAPA
jgi:transposase